MPYEYFSLSFYGVHYWLLPYTDSATIPTAATAADEITSVINSGIGKINKENTTFRTLGGNGWESIVPLGQGMDPGEFQCIREGTGGLYTGADNAGSTYNRILKWFMDATKAGGATAAKCIIEVIPRGENQYDGNCYFVTPENWDPGERSTETGQQYSFTVHPFGPPTQLTVTHTAAQGETPESWSFAPISA